MQRECRFCGEGGHRARACPARAAALACAEPPPPPERVSRTRARAGAPGLPAILFEAQVYMPAEQLARVKGMADAYVKHAFCRGGAVDSGLVCAEVFGRCGGCFNLDDDGHLRVAAYLLGRYGDPSHEAARAWLAALERHRGGDKGGGCAAVRELLRSEFGLVRAVHGRTGRAYYRRRTGWAL